MIERTVVGLDVCQDMAWRGEDFVFLSVVRGTTTTRDSFRFDQRAARFGAAVPPMYLSTRMRALDVRV